LKLEMLMKEADQRLAALHAVTHSASHPVPPSSTLNVDIPPPAIDPRHAEVYVLADKGHTAHEIAQRLERLEGEIELILALREPAGSARA
jgi:DNA-binding NarL/FixJ family response regulator